MPPAYSFLIQDKTTKKERARGREMDIEIIKKERAGEKSIKYLCIDAQCFSTFGDWEST